MWNALSVNCSCPYAYSMLVGWHIWHKNSFKPNLKPFWVLGQFACLTTCTPSLLSYEIVILWTCSKGEVPMAPAPIVVAVIIGGIGITSVAWPLKAVTFCRWYHLKKPKWVQDLPFADLVMRSWMPTYFRIMGVFFCVLALGLVWSSAH